MQFKSLCLAFHPLTGLQIIEMCRGKSWHWSFSRWRWDIKRFWDFWKPI